MRPGIAVAQHHLNHPEAIDDCHRRLIAAPLAVGERGLGRFQRDARSQGLVGHERFLRVGKADAGPNPERNGRIAKAHGFRHCKTSLVANEELQLSHDHEGFQRKSCCF